MIGNFTIQKIARLSDKSYGFGYGCEQSKGTAADNMYLIAS
jgi:hypothetical protein